MGAAVDPGVLRRHPTGRRSGRPPPWSPPDCWSGRDRRPAQSSWWPTQGSKSGTAGWTCTAETGTGTPAHTGTAALVGRPTSTTGECGQTIPVTAGAAYTLTAWVRGAFVFLGASGTSTGEVSTWTPGTNGTYGQLTVRFTRRLDAGAGLGARLVRAGHLPGRRRVAAGAGHRAAHRRPPTTRTATAPRRRPARRPRRRRPAGHRGLPKHILTGYWHNFDNGSSTCGCGRAGRVRRGRDRLRQRDRHPRRGQLHHRPRLSTALGGYTDANFTADVRTLQPRGKKVMMSVGGELGTVSVNDAASANAFATSVGRSDPVRLRRRRHRPGERRQPDVHGPGAARRCSPRRASGLDPRDGPADDRHAVNRRGVLPARARGPGHPHHGQTQYYNSGTMLGCDGRCTHRARSTSSPHWPASSCRAGCGRTRSRSACRPSPGGGRRGGRAVRGRLGAELPRPGRRLRLVPPADDVAGHSRCDDLVDQLGPGAGVRVREHRGAGARPAAVAGLRGGAAGVPHPASRAAL